MSSETTSDSARFHHKLLKSTFDDLDELPFSTVQALRDQICTAAFQHGIEARQQAVTDGTPTINIKQILVTLANVKKLCPPGPGRGRVCN